MASKDTAPDAGSVDDIDPALRQKLEQRYGGTGGGDFVGWTLDGDHWREAAGTIV